MMPGMNPKMLKQAMKKMGVKEQTIDAYQVIIKTSSGNLLINNPTVTKIEMMGQESIQITGTIEEEQTISEEDIETVSSTANVSKEIAKEALEKNDGDLAKAILSLENK